MIGIFSHFGGDTLALNVSQDICEKIKFGEDGYYFLPINEDKTPVEPYIHLQNSPQKGLISIFSSYLLKDWVK